MAVSATPQTPEHAPISFGAWLGVVLLFLFFGIFVLVLVAIAPHGNTYEAKRAEARGKKLNDARTAATQELNSYAWVDKGKGIARIPIDRAMEITLRDLASKPEPANPIETPAQAPASGASPAPAVSPAPAAAAGTPKPTSVEGPNSEIGISRLRPGIHPAPYQGLSRVQVRHPPPRLRRQVANLHFRPCLNKSRPASPFLSPERRRHDLLRMNPTEIPLKSPGSVTDLSIGEVEQVERALIDASTRLPVLMFYASAIAWLLIGTLIGGSRFVQTAFARLVRQCELSDLGADPSGPHEHHDLRMGVDGRNGNSHLADGAPLPDHVALSASARHRRGILEPRRPCRHGGNSGR